MSFDYSKYSPNSGLSVQQKQFLMTRIPEAEGEEYAVLLFDGLAAQTFEMSSVCVFGGESGPNFMGVLGSEKESSPVSGKWWIPVGISFKTKQPLTAKAMHQQVPTEALPTLVAQFARSAFDTDVKVENCVELYVGYPARRAYLIIAHDEEMSTLSCIELSGDTVKQIPIVSTSLPKVGEALLLNRYNDESERTPHGASVHILPDIDGNGANEFVILSEVSALFSIDSGDTSRDGGDHVHIREVQSCYFGP